MLLIFRMFTSQSYFAGIGDDVLLGAIITLFLVYFLYQIIQRLLPENDEAENIDTTTGRVRANLQNCPICLGDVAFAIETNCGHVFCGQCIISYYDTVRTSSVTTALSKEITNTYRVSQNLTNSLKKFLK